MKKPPLPPDAFCLAEINHRPKINDGPFVYQDATTAFYQLVLAVTKELDKDDYTDKKAWRLRSVPHTGKFYPTGIFSTVHQAPEQVEKCLNKLFNAMNDALEQARLHGIERGGDLLISLARGDITVKEMNNQSVKTPPDGK